MNENQNPGKEQSPPAPAPQAAPGLVSAGSAFEKALAELKAGHDLPDFQPTATPPVEPLKPPLPPRRHPDWAVWLCVLALVGVGAWYFISNHLATVREKNAAKIQHNKRRADIAALVLKYSAIKNWEASLPNRSAGRSLFDRCFEGFSRQQSESRFSSSAFWTTSSRKRRKNLCQFFKCGHR